MMPDLLKSMVSISSLCGSADKCNLRQVRRFDLPCVRIFHSPSPYTFKPVLSTTNTDFSLFPFGS